MPRQSAGFLAGLLLLLAFGIPVGAAQISQTFGAVTQCSTECTPASVNANTLKKANEPVTTILYAHVESLLGAPRLNTQVPTGAPDINNGFLTPTATVGCVIPSAPTCINFRNNRFVMYTLPGTVEYGDRVRYSTRNGTVGHDMTLAGDKVYVYWYLSPGASGLHPGLRVSATMEAARQPGLGPVLAASAPEGVGPVNMVAGPNDGGTAYELKIPLTILNRTVRGGTSDSGFLVLVSFRQAEAGAGDVDTGQWRLRAGPKWLPRVVLTTERVLFDAGAEISRTRDHAFIRWSVQSGWGSYDVNESSARLTQVAGTPILPEALTAATVTRGVHIESDISAVTFTWRIPYAALGAPDGNYTFRASVQNRQLTYELEQDFTFSIVKGVVRLQGVAPLDEPRGKTPAASLWQTVLVGIGAAMLVGRRPRAPS